MIGRERPEPPLEVLELMRKPDLADTRPGANERRMVAIGTMSRALRAEGRRRRNHSSWRTVAIAAVLLVAGGAAWSRYHGVRHPSVARVAAPVATPESDPVEVEVSSGVAVATRHGVASVVSTATRLRIAEGDAVRTGPDARATLLLPRGVRVDLFRATKASIVSAQELDQKIALDIGETLISVPRPGGPHTFSVATPDARVIVHGTEFTVRVDEADASHRTRTSVSVTRGAVSVIDAKGERLLNPGDTWSAADAAPPAAPPVLGLPQQRAHAVVSKEAASSLAEQNRLFQAALDARRAGDDALALKAIDELFARYPDTTLAQEARLARFRALKSLNRGQDAAREARRYLSAHPDAPAADEARRALLESTTGP